MLLQQNRDGSATYDPSNPDAFQKRYIQRDTVDQRMNLKE